MNPHRAGRHHEEDEEEEDVTGLTAAQLHRAAKHLSRIASTEHVDFQASVKPQDSTRLPVWLKTLIPILFSSLLSSGLTGIGTVNSIRQDLAVEHASVQLLIADHDRRIAKLEHDIVPRAEHEEEDKALDSVLANLQEQSKQTNASVDEIRQMLFRTQLKSVPEARAR